MNGLANAVMQSAPVRSLSDIKGFFDTAKKVDFPSLAKSSFSSASRVVAPMSGPISSMVSAGVDVSDLGTDENPLQGAVDTATSAVPGAGTAKSMSPKMKAGIIQGIGLLGDTMLQMHNAKQNERSQMKLIAKEFDIAQKDLEANANIRMSVMKAAQTRSLVDRLSQLERLKNTGGIQAQRFVES